MSVFGDGVLDDEITLLGDEAQFLRQFDSVVLREADKEPETELPQAGFLGANPETGRPPINIFGKLTETRGSRAFRIVSYYTIGNAYERHAAKLVETLERFDLTHTVVPIRDLGGWELNCAHKAEFVLDQWEKSTVPIVWLDADATVELPPVLFGALQTDICIHKNAWTLDERLRGWEFCSGTVYFGKSERTRRLLTQWLLRCRADPATWDQVHLHSAWCDVNATTPLRTTWLPRPYLQITGGWQEEPAVIRHWQASREGLREKLPSLALTEAGKRDRQNNRIWRTAEEVFWIREGRGHIKPELGHTFPEGFDVGLALKEAVDGRYPLLEVGCGVGRIAALFPPEDYLGVDVSPDVVGVARQSLPSHEIRLIDAGYRLPPCLSILFYTVLMHVSDDAVDAQLQSAAATGARIIIGELMDRRWRRDGVPPVFNRDPEDYVSKLDRLGYRLSSYRKYEYERYAREPWNVGRDSRISILVFDPTATVTEAVETAARAEQLMVRLNEAEMQTSVYKEQWAAAVADRDRIDRERATAETRAAVYEEQWAAAVADRDRIDAERATAVSLSAVFEEQWAAAVADRDRLLAAKE